MKTAPPPPTEWLWYAGRAYCQHGGWSIEPWSEGHFVKLDLDLFLRLNREKRHDV